MRKSYRKQSRFNKNRKRNKRKSRKYRGGSYYPYNNNPMRFTRSTTQMGGGISMDPRNTFFPDSLVTLGRSFVYNMTPNTINGAYSVLDPNPSVQPIMLQKYTI